MNKLLIQFHHLGPVIKSSPSDFLSSTDEYISHQRSQLASFLSVQPTDITTEVIERYVDVTPEEGHQAITPAHEKIQKRIIEPLRIAKKSYCFEEYISSIALSGIVGEMMAHVLLQLYEAQIEEFDTLGQMKRIKLLRDRKYIHPDQETMLKNLQNTRRPYMHWWNLGKSADEIKDDAKNAVVTATKLFSSVFDIKLASSSSISIDGRAQAFLEKIGESIGPYYSSKY